MLKPTITSLKNRCLCLAFAYMIMGHDTEITKKFYFPSGKQIAKKYSKLNNLFYL